MVGTNRPALLPTLALIAAVLAVVGRATPAMVTPVRAQGFIAGIEDLPLMPGLQAVPGTELDFDNPSGRIVGVEAAGAVKRDQVLAFYRATLPQLGWRPAGETTFERDDERLKIDFVAGDPAVTVRFTLSPK